MPAKHLIPDAEWDFRLIPEDQLVHAFVYEYSRSQTWIQDAIKNAPRAFGKGKRLPVRYELVVRRNRRTWSDLLKTAKAHGYTVLAGGEKFVPTYEIRTNRTYQSQPTEVLTGNPRVLEFGPGFPKLPFSENKSPIAFLNVTETVPMPPVQDLKGWLSKTHGIQKARFDDLAEQYGWEDRRIRFSVEPNGLPAPEFPNDTSWKRFALAIDFSRPDDELKSAFMRFLKETRNDYRLGEVKKTERLNRGGLPMWLSKRYAEDGLSILAISRILDAHGGNAQKAGDYLRENSKPAKRANNLRLHYSSPKEVRRAAGKYKGVAMRMFGKFARITGSVS